MYNQYKIQEERLLNEFIRWAKINAPSQYEKNISIEILDKLKTLGFTTKFDEAHKNFDGEIGNLYAYWEGTDPDLEPIMFSTHMDTVLPTEGLQVEIRDGVIYSDGTTILGADDRAALASYFEAIESIQEQNIPCGPIELILTVNEQKGLTGSRYLEKDLVKSKKGYVFDSSGDVGQIIQQGPYSSKFIIDVHGKSSHIGLNPTEGNSAFHIASHIILNIEVGEIDKETLVNIGEIHGGELTSIIPGHVQLIGEVRAFTKERHDEILDEIFKVAKEEAEKQNGSVQVQTLKKYSGFKINDQHELVQNAIQAGENLGLPYYQTRTLGGADTNNLNEHGIEVITLGNGFRNIHTFQEHISIENLNNTSRYTLALIVNWYERQKG